jgi:hypothetical protein
MPRISFFDWRVPAPSAILPRYKSPLQGGVFQLKVLKPAISTFLYPFCGFAQEFCSNHSF